MTILNQLDKAAADGRGVLWWVTGGWLHKLIPQRSSNLRQSVYEWEDCGVNVLFKMLCYLGHVKVTYMKNGIRTHNFHKGNVSQRTRSLGWIYEPTTICSRQRHSMKKRCILFFAMIMVIFTCMKFILTVSYTQQLTMFSFEPLNSENQTVLTEERWLSAECQPIQNLHLTRC